LAILVLVVVNRESAIRVTTETNVTIPTLLTIGKLVGIPFSTSIITAEGGIRVPFLHPANELIQPNR
jgi:hypothetical protein